MNAIHSPTDYPALLDIINASYPVTVEQVHLHRDMIGWVYLVQGQSQKYILKLYRHFDSENALRSIHIIEYLHEKDYPVVSIVPNLCGERYITINTPQGPSVAILFVYLEGAEPDFNTELVDLSRQVGRLHRLMKGFPEPLIRRGKDFYIDRYIDILRALDYDPNRIADLEAYGIELWAGMEHLPPGFCHGDLHTGNMIQTEAGRYVVFDFDVASYTSPVVDVATLCDASNFNNFDESAYAATTRVFERFYPGYGLENELTDTEIRALYDFIPIRHYEIIATITNCQGLNVLSRAFLDEQYWWFMNWRNVCEQKGRRLGQ